MLFQRVKASNALFLTIHPGLSHFFGQSHPWKSARKEKEQATMPPKSQLKAVASKCVDLGLSLFFVLFSQFRVLNYLSRLLNSEIFILSYYINDILKNYSQQCISLYIGRFIYYHYPSIFFSLNLTWKLCCRFTAFVYVMWCYFDFIINNYRMCSFSEIHIWYYPSFSVQSIAGVLKSYDITDCFLNLFLPRFYSIKYCEE